MKTKNKKTIYILLFIVLGILLSFVVHGLVEMWYINKLVSDFPKYSFGYTWADWFVIHKYFSILLLALGILFGYYQGKFWWRLVYEQKRFDPFFKKLHKLFR